MIQSRFVDSVPKCVFISLEKNKVRGRGLVHSVLLLEFTPSVPDISKLRPQGWRNLRGRSDNKTIPVLHRYPLSGNLPAPEILKVPRMFVLSVALMLSMLIMNLPMSASLRVVRTIAVRSRSQLMMSSKAGGRVSAAVSQDAAASSNNSTSTSTSSSTSSSPPDNSKKVFDLNPPKGTRDFYPEDHRLKSWLFSHWREIGKKFGFEEYDAPVVESEDLYIRKAGEEVTQQLYNFEDKGGRRLSLRPEMTPSLARMVLAKKNALSFPLKWFSIPQCWRYERMTRGRRREHYQWNMDIWGVEGIEAEVELISAIVASFEGLGITSQDVGIKVNSRKILNGLMEAVGIPKEKWVQTCILVDKLEKVPVSALQDDLSALGISSESVEELLESLKMNSIEQFEEKLGSTSEGVVDIKKMLALAEAYGVRDWLQFDASVVRGLAYYTGVVFEGFDRSGELRAICGGGRYDLLLSSLSNGKESMCAVGFGFGDAVIVELLKMKNALPDFSRNEDVDVVVYAMPGVDAADTTVAFKSARLATELRKSGKTVYVILDSRKPKWVFQKADKLGASAVVVLGSDEDSKGGVTIKSLASGEQTFCRYEDVVTTL